MNYLAKKKEIKMPVSAMYYPDISGERRWIWNGEIQGVFDATFSTGATQKVYFSPIVFERPISFNALTLDITGNPTRETSIKGAFYASSEEGLPGRIIPHTKFSKTMPGSTSRREPIELENYIFPAGVYWLALSVTGSGSTLSQRQRATLGTNVNYVIRPLPLSAGIEGEYDEKIHSNYPASMQSVFISAPFSEELPEDLSIETDRFEVNYVIQIPAFAVRVTTAARGLVYSEEVRKV